MWPRSAITATAFLTLLGVNEAAAELKTFRDWLVACDNLRSCTALGIGETPTGAALRITRAAGAQAAPVVTVLVDVEKDVTFTLAFDDAEAGGLPQGPQRAGSSDHDKARLEIKDPAAVEALIGALRKAGKLIVRRTDPPGARPSDPLVSEVSLSGAVAAMLYMDEQQGRLGNTTALVRRGDKPASAVPAPPPAPVVVAAKPGTAKLPEEPQRAVLANSGKMCGDGEKPEPADIQKLSGNLVLYWFYCREGSGAYNHYHGILVAPAGQPQAARQPQFRTPPEAKDARDEMLTNGSFDEETMILSTFAKARGLGDCGDYTEWVWTGQDFALLKVSTMPNCAGLPLDDWPVTYQAIRK